MEHSLGKKEGFPFAGSELARLTEFLAAEGLDYDEGIDYSLVLLSGGQIVATGSCQANVLKCVAVSSAYQGQGLLAQVVTGLIYHLTERGIRHYFLFTKESNRIMFRDMFFHEIAAARGILLMENRKNGIGQYAKELQTETEAAVAAAKAAAAAFAASGDDDEAGAASASGAGDGEATGIGAIIANCNPFTHGHQYLMETAAKQCEWLHVFILAQNNQSFSEALRFQLVQEGTSHIPNLILHRASDYLVSPATFPTYFIKEKGKALEDNCILDLTVFVKHVAPALGITKRFVGTEPYCQVTKQYNDCMSWFLPEHNIEFVEITRLEEAGEAISASRVRAGLSEGSLADVLQLLPESSWAHLGQVELEEMLAARERRATTQQRLVSQHQQPLISFTLNIPGPLKVSRGIYRVYQEGLARIEKALAAAGLSVLQQERVEAKTGLEGYWCVAAEPCELKRLVVALEEEDAIARLFDIDVIAVADGQPVSRSELGLLKRACILCDQPAHVCGRSRAHSLEELTTHIDRLIADFLAGGQR